eukprot:3940926-Rhodomonas_salina.1
MYYVSTGHCTARAYAHSGEEKKNSATLVGIAPYATCYSTRSTMWSGGQYGNNGGGRQDEHSRGTRRGQRSAWRRSAPQT